MWAQCELPPTGKAELVETTMEGATEKEQLGAHSKAKQQNRSACACPSHHSKEKGTRAPPGKPSPLLPSNPLLVRQGGFLLGTSK